MPLFFSSYLMDMIDPQLLPLLWYEQTTITCEWLVVCSYIWHIMAPLSSSSSHHYSASIIEWWMMLCNHPFWMFFFYYYHQPSTWIINMFIFFSLWLAIIHCWWVTAKDSWHLRTVGRRWFVSHLRVGMVTVTSNQNRASTNKQQYGSGSIALISMG